MHLRSSNQRSQSSRDADGRDAPHTHGHAVCGRSPPPRCRAPTRARSCDSLLGSATGLCCAQQRQMRDAARPWTPRSGCTATNPTARRNVPDMGRCMGAARRNALPRRIAARDALSGTHRGVRSRLHRWQQFAPRAPRCVPPLRPCEGCKREVERGGPTERHAEQHLRAQ
jgi:hypothetical protein